jgi:hypothetical protein
MKTSPVVAALVGAILATAEFPVSQPPALVTTPLVPSVPDAELSATVRHYCLTCHNDQLLTGNLTLQGFDVAAAPQAVEKVEKMVVKLRAGMMPPPGMPRPGGDTLVALVERLEELVDRSAAARPNPGYRRFQRLNRAEYQRAVRDLLQLDVDAGTWLPVDIKSDDFDDIADVQAISPTLLEAYLSAANDVSRMAVGDPDAPSDTRSYAPPSGRSGHEWDHVAGAPFGSRGGVVVDHVFPTDAEYVFEVRSRAGTTQFEQLDISVDGESVALLDVEGGIAVVTDPITVRAGQQRVSAAFVRKMEGPYADVFSPRWAQGGTYGATSPMQLSELIIRGPFNATGVSESASASRRKIFTCRPLSAPAAEQRECARDILARLGAEAYRRPALPAEDLAALMTFYDEGVAEGGGFDQGVTRGLQGILASPHFIFRLERRPSGVKPGETYPLADVELASRLSFFLWGAPPDQELLAVASEGRLSDPRVLEAQARRLLADPRSDALGPRFAAQWLRLEEMTKVQPDRYWFPTYDQQLADAMLRETELFFTNLIREDRSFLELITADYTFVDERLARHYGIPNVTGTHFRRAQYPDGSRRGILGHGSVLLSTSMSIRTSPVLRGKWVMEVLMGTPPPPPPPDVPALETTAGVQDGRPLTTRERMEVHRANPTCNACHRFMDPIGLALDNFDVIGSWRSRENGAPLDTRGTFYDGTPVATSGDLVGVLMKRPIPLVRTFTRNLMAYALGRRIEDFDQPTVRAIAKAAEADDYRMSSFILGVVKSDAFRMKRAEIVTSDR